MVDARVGRANVQLSNRIYVIKLLDSTVINVIIRKIDLD